MAKFTKVVCDICGDEISGKHYGLTREVYSKTVDGYTTTVTIEINPPSDVKVEDICCNCYRGRWLVGGAVEALDTELLY